MTLHTCEYISPRLRTRANGEYVCFAIRMTRRLYMDMGSGETSAGVRSDAGRLFGFERGEQVFVRRDDVFQLFGPGASVN
jgi:hypothetical protein